MLDIPVSVRVRSLEEAAFIKQVREFLINQPESIGLLKDLLKFATDGRLDLVHEGGGNLLVRVVALEQKFDSLRLAVDNLLQANVRQQPSAEKDVATIIEGFTNFRSQKCKTNRLAEDEKVLLAKLFQDGMTNSQIAKISGMSSQGVGKQREKWKDATEKEKDKVDFDSKAVNRQDTPQVVNTSYSSSKGAENAESAQDTLINEEVEVIPPPLKDELQKRKAVKIENLKTTSPCSQSHCSDIQKISVTQVNTDDHQRKRRSRLNNLEITKVANMLVARKFREKFTLKQIGSAFNISPDAIKKTYLPRLTKAGLLAVDKKITHQMVLKAFASQPPS